MSAFEKEVDRLVECLWIAESAKKSLFAFYESAIDKANEIGYEEGRSSMQEDIASVIQGEVVLFETIEEITESDRGYHRGLMVALQSTKDAE